MTLWKFVRQKATDKLNSLKINSQRVIYPLTVGDVMTDDDLEQHYQNMLFTFGDRMPNFEKEPIRFKYYVKLYKHLLMTHHGVTL